MLVHTHRVCPILGFRDVTRLLLERGADPDVPTSNGCTAVLRACATGKPVVVQTLACFGADMETVDAKGYGATVYAEAYENGDIVTWLESVSGWHPFKIAVACRLADTARATLRLGRTDPADCALAELVAAGSTAAGSLWPGSPGVCPVTLRLAHGAKAGWSPTRHFLFHAGVRSSIQIVLLVAERLLCQCQYTAQTQHGSAVGVRRSIRQLHRRPPVLRSLPPLVWRIVCSFLLRSDWEVPPP